MLLTATPHHTLLPQSQASLTTSLLGAGGLFVLTTCNWTKEEILSQFSAGEQEMQETAPYVKPCMYLLFTVSCPRDS